LARAGSGGEANGIRERHEPDLRAPNNKDPNVPLEIVVVLMLLVASAVAMVTRRLRIPYTVALVVVGLILSVIRSNFYPEFDLGLHLTKDLLFVVLLPVLIYEAAFHLELRDFLSNWKAILTLAVPGLLVGILLCGGAIHGALWAINYPFAFGGALLVATIVAATDPVGVISLLRATRAPRRLSVLMEGESLLNDGVAVVAFNVVLVALGLSAVQDQVTVTWLLKFLSWELLGAILLGGGLGFFMAWLTSKVDDHLIEITLSTIGAFGSFVIAEKVHASGVIACLVAGMLAGNFGAKYGMSASTRVAVVSFWEYACFVANSITFLLIGLDVDPVQLLRDWPAMLVTWVAMLLSRGLFVYATLPQIARLEGGLPRGFGTVVIWGGIRGGIAMVLALSIPREFEFRSLAVNCIFGASLLTILVQSTTMGGLLKKLGLASDRKAFEIVERMRARLRALHAALSYLERQREIGVVPPVVYEEARSELQREAEALQREQEQARDMEDQIRQEEMLALRRKLLLVRKESLRQASVDGAIDPDVMRVLVGELDEKLHHLELSHHSTPDDRGGAGGAGARADGGEGGDVARGGAAGYAETERDDDVDGDPEDRAL
jgi:CPA1 family monovalent cation:H+ antiporter